MSIGRRFWNLARSELNALLDRARALDDDDASEHSGAGHDDAWHDEDNAFSGFTDDELAAELARRRSARAQAARRAARTAAREAGRAGDDRGGAPRPARPAAVDPVRNAYRTLELPEGADLDAVKKAYRTLMRKYHPDRHTGSQDKLRAAHELTTRITEAYKVLRRHLGERG